MSDEIPFAPDLPNVESHTWTASSLVALAANPPAPPTIGGLLYPGKRTILSGETESLKTWAALILAKSEMDIGYPVGWVDVDAMGPGEILSRLRALGVEDTTTDELFRYYEPEEPLVGDVLEEVCGEIAALGIRLFVVDAFNPILSLHGLDPNSTSDVEKFWREVATPITVAGAAPTMLDHVAKNAKPGGKYAYGSERKATGATVHVGFRLLERFTRGGTGRTLLATLKDRPGWLPSPAVGRLVLVSDEDGTAVTYRLQEDRSHGGDVFRPTILMERVSRRLEGETEPRSQTWIEENVRGNVPGIRDALALLVGENYVARERGNRGFEHTSVRPYREADDVLERDVDATPSKPRPTPSFDLRSTLTRSTPSPSSPKRTEWSGVVDTDADPVPDPVLESRNHHRWPELIECLDCGALKGARINAGVTYFVCGHQRVMA